ncbi:cation diffusion facilitator family transporter, partial [Chloroflexota bacterium]
MLATKENVAKLSIFSISLLIIMKAVASILTGSVAIRADAVHSAIDLSGVIIGYVGIKISSKPADEEHAFGHGKAEHIASGIIAGLIFVAAGAIFYQAIQRLVARTTVELITLGIYVTLAAIVINTIVSWYALRVARSTDSVALEATARDLFADVLSSCAVLVGLVLVKLTGISILDSIVAMLVAIIIARAAYLTIRKSFGGLMDTKLPKIEEDELMSCIMEHSGQLVGFHAVRTRKAGSQRFIDLHL